MAEKYLALRKQCGQFHIVAIYHGSIVKIFHQNVELQKKKRQQGFVGASFEYVMTMVFPYKFIHLVTCNRTRYLLWNITYTR